MRGTMKHSIKGKLLIVLIVFLTALIFSCGEGIVRETIKWEEDGSGYIQYSTNDEDYYNNGYFKPYMSTEQTPYSGTTFSLIRKNGSIYAGYGGVVCYQNNSNFYRILINGNGKYLISKKINGTYSDITLGWIESGQILTVYDQVNEIEIVRNDLTNIFTININGGPDITFEGTELTFGSSGFYTSIGNSYTGEIFPYEANDVRFKITGPTPIP